MVSSATQAKCSHLSLNPPRSMIISITVSRTTFFSNCLNCFTCIATLPIFSHVLPRDARPSTLLNYGCNRKILTFLQMLWNVTQIVT